MRLLLASRGGHLPGAMEKRSTIVDMRTLDPHARQKGEALVSAAREAAKDYQARAPGGDAMSYSVTIETDTDTVTLKQSDNDMTPEFADLMDWIEMQ